MRKEEEKILDELKGVPSPTLLIFLSVIRHLKSDLKSLPSKEVSTLEASELLGKKQGKLSGSKLNKQTYFSIQELSE